MSPQTDKSWRDYRALWRAVQFNDRRDGHNWYRTYIHSREIETLHLFNGKYIGYCLKY